MRVYNILSQLFGLIIRSRINALVHDSTQLQMSQNSFRSENAATCYNLTWCPPATTRYPSSALPINLSFWEYVMSLHYINSQYPPTAAPPLMNKIYSLMIQELCIKPQIAWGNILRKYFEKMIGQIRSLSKPPGPWLLNCKSYFQLDSNLLQFSWIRKFLFCKIWRKLDSTSNIILYLC